MTSWIIFMTSDDGKRQIFNEFDNEDDAREFAGLYDYTYTDDDGNVWALEVAEASNNKTKDGDIVEQTLSFKYADNATKKKAEDEKWNVVSVERTEAHRVDDSYFDLALSIVKANNGDKDAYFIVRAYTNEALIGPFDDLKHATGEFLHQWEEERPYDEPEFDYESDYDEEGNVKESLDTNKRYDIFGDEIEDSKLSSPQTWDDNAVSSLLNSLIIDEYEAIKGYNDAILNIQSAGYENMINTLQDIVNEENKHVGQLQELMKMVSSNAESVSKGEQEAVNQIAQPIFKPLKSDISQEVGIIGANQATESNDDMWTSAMYADGPINDEW